MIAGMYIYTYFRILEAILIVMVTTVCIFLTATLLGTCVRERKDDKEEIYCPGLTVHKLGLYELLDFVIVHLLTTFQGDLSFRNETRNYFCPEFNHNKSNTYYNDMATLVFNSQETAIKQLFHQSGRQLDHMSIT